MSQKQSTSESLKLFTQCLQQVPDPRTKHGTYQPFSALLTLVFLAPLAEKRTIDKKTLQKTQKVFSLRLRTECAEKSCLGG